MTIHGRLKILISIVVVQLEVQIRQIQIKSQAIHEVI